MSTSGDRVCGVSQHEASRYSRQILVPDVGVSGFRKIAEVSILVVGAGGLGSPAVLYLAGAGVGRIGIMDGDNVDESNLHRQVIHSEQRVGMNKAASGALACQALNSGVVVHTHQEFLTVQNALEIVSQYDVVLDATDNVVTRYLLNDACVLKKKPLVSGSALRLEGQLTVYSYCDGPCYRCIFPDPPPSHTVTNCSDGGVMGPVPGVIGTLQAMEALKVAMGKGDTEVLTGRMLLYEASTCRFRTIKLRARNRNCAICGDNPTLQTLVAVDGVAHDGCTVQQQDLYPELPALLPAHFITCEKYREVRKLGEKHLLLDVREAIQFEICHLPDAMNVPLARLKESAGAIRCAVEELQPRHVYVVCRRGRQSKTAARMLLAMSVEGAFGGEGVLAGGADAKISHVEGGLAQWSRDVDPLLPLY